MLHLLLGAITIAVAVASVTENLRGTHKPAAKPFTMLGHTYDSHEHFIKSGKRCGTKSVPEGDLSDINKRLREIQKTIHRTIAIDVQVYWHVITSTSGTGTVPQSQVEAQIAVMNHDYLNSGVRFILASYGVTANNAWFNLQADSPQEMQMKTALRVGTAADLNVYSIANSQGILGWAAFPSDAAGDLTYDGVVVDYRTLPGGSAAPYNLGATMTHEVGHWMGLYHTFQDGCQMDVNAGDEVADTPCEAEPAYGCPPDTTDTCVGTTGGFAGFDPIHNYMDYTDDSCMTNFTPDQATRMKSAWVAYRQQ